MAGAGSVEAGLASTLSSQTSTVPIVLGNCGLMGWKVRTQDGAQKKVKPGWVVAFGERAASFQVYVPWLHGRSIQLLASLEYHRARCLEKSIPNCTYISSKDGASLLINATIKI